MLSPMLYRHEHAHVADLHLEVWVASERAHWRIENIKTHEQLCTGWSESFEMAKAEAYCLAEVGDPVEWKRIGLNSPGSCLKT
jgi:hypothetical protein